MRILESKFVQGFIKMANDGYLQGWHERNGGNLSYRLKAEEVEMIRPRLNAPGEWTPIGTEVPGLAGEFFLVTGSGKYFRNIIVDPEVCLAIIELDETGCNYRIRWGLVEGGRPTSELPTHLMNHEVKKKLTNGKHRVIYHAHTTNTIAQRTLGICNRMSGRISGRCRSCRLDGSGRKRNCCKDSGTYEKI